MDPSRRVPLPPVDTTQMALALRHLFSKTKRQSLGILPMNWIPGFPHEMPLLIQDSEQDVYVWLSKDLSLIHI